MMKMSPWTRLKLRALVLADRIGTFRRDVRALAATEFALILPAMIMLYIGGVEVTRAMTANRKVAHLTSTLGDLATQTREISNTEMANIFEAAQAIMVPYPTGEELTLLLTFLRLDSNSVARVVWSDAVNRQPLPVNSIVSVPTAVQQPNTFLVLSEVTYEYKPILTYFFTGPFQLEDDRYLRPRLSETIGRH
ncbi:MAG: pilus assembly protein [Bauldia sp.]|nr:pilus assembly protein [Bauldia sp.]